MENLVLIPGTLCSGELWDHQKIHLAEHVNVSIADITRDSSIESMAERILAESPETFALAGLSLGGIVALEVMRQSSKRVRRLALLDTNPNAPRADQITLWRNQVERVHNGEFSDVTESEFLPLLLHESRKQEGDLLEVIRRMFETVGEAGFVRQLLANIHRPVATEVLATILCPTLVLAGRQDTLCPVSLQRDMARRIPKSQLVFIERCGHLSTLEQPEAVTAVLSYWLQMER